MKAPYQQPDEMLTPRVERQPQAKTGSHTPVIPCRTALNPSKTALKRHFFVQTGFISKLARLLLPRERDGRGTNPLLLNRTKVAKL